MKTNEEIFKNRIYDLISANLEIRDVPYVPDDLIGMKEISHESKEKATSAIIKFLMEKENIEEIASMFEQMVLEQTKDFHDGISAKYELISIFKKYVPS